MALGELIWALKEQDQVGLVRTFRKLSTPFKRVDEARYRDDMERYLAKLFAGQNECHPPIGHHRRRAERAHAVGPATRQRAYPRAEGHDPGGGDILYPLSGVGRQPGDIAMATITEFMRQQLNAEPIMDALRMEATRSARELVGNLPSLADATTKWIQQYQRGRLSVHIDTSDIEGQLKSTQKALDGVVNRLVVGFVLAGLLVGSAIASTVD